MIYNSLEILPIKVFFKILKTNDFKLLSNENIDEKELRTIWESLYDEYKELDPDDQINKTLKLSQKIEMLIAKYKSIKIAVECLKHKADEELINLLREHGYRLTDYNFNNDLQQIERESEALLLKTEMFKKQLPKQSETEEKKANIDNTLASYSLILGFDFDYNTISVTKFFALQNQVKLKIKALEKNG